MAGVSPRCGVARQSPRAGGGKRKREAPVRLADKTEWEKIMVSFGGTRVGWGWGGHRMGGADGVWVQTERGREDTGLLGAIYNAGLSRKDGS